MPLELSNTKRIRQIIAMAETFAVALNLILAIVMASSLRHQPFPLTIDMQLLLISIVLLWIAGSRLTQDTGMIRSGNHLMLLFDTCKISLIIALTVFILYLILNPGISPLWVLFFIPLNLLVVTGIRMFSVRLLKISRIRGHDIRKVLLIVDDVQEETVSSILENKEWGYQVLYVLTDSDALKTKFKQQSRIYPKKANIRSLLRHDIVDEIIYIASSHDRAYMQELALICSELGINLLLHPLLGMNDSYVRRIQYIGKTPFTLIGTSPRLHFSYHLKNALEILFSATALFALSPLLLLIAILIKIDSKGPVIFKQQRVGLRGRKFYIYKFRTMIADAEQLKTALMKRNESDGPVFKIRNDPRITSFGLLLRKTGLDEIPQFFNVIKGEMSLIGPRPPLYSEVEKYERWHLKRLSVKPGITCTWQVEPERNQVPFDRWMHLDLDYIDNWSVKSDFVLFFRTVRSLFQARGL